MNRKHATLNNHVADTISTPIIQKNSRNLWKNLRNPQKNPRNLWKNLRNPQKNLKFYYSLFNHLLLSSENFQTILNII